jgi:hypothetical protein
MFTRLLLTACLFAGLTGAARSEDPRDEIRRLREENLKLREELARQQKRLEINEALAREADLVRKTAQERDRELAEVRRLVDEQRKQAALAQEQAQLALKRAETELAALKQEDRKRISGLDNVKDDARRELARTVEKMQRQMQELMTRADEERKARIQAEVEMKTIQARGAELEAQLREMAQQLVRLKAGGADPKKNAPDNFPAQNIEGRVMDVDRESGLFTISIGSDAGLKQGHTLRVFRLDPAQPKYLGVVEVVSVMPTRAVAKFKGKPTVPVKSGDRVASNLLGEDK